MIDLQATINQWHKDLASGAIYGRRLSERTQKLHKHNLKPIIRHLEGCEMDTQSIIKAFIKAQEETQAKEDAKRKHQYDALVSFAKSLVFHGVVE